MEEGYPPIRIFAKKCKCEKMIIKNSVYAVFFYLHTSNFMRNIQVHGILLMMNNMLMSGNPDAIHFDADRKMEATNFRVRKKSYVRIFEVEHVADEHWCSICHISFMQRNWKKLGLLLVSLTSFLYLCVRAVYQSLSNIMKPSSYENVLTNIKIYVQ